jgi:dolichyl-phosphate beta-glucosyltransferase
MYLSVVIPAYNEAKRIGPTIQSVGTWLAKQSFDGEVIVVDNNSKDATVQVCEGYIHQFPFLKVLEERRQGKAYAVQSGMLAAQGEVRLFMDADNSTTVDHFEKARPYLDQGFDVVIGSLAMPGASIAKGGEEPLWRVVLGKLGNLWIQFWAVPGVWDTQRGFKVLTAQAVEDIFPRLTTFGWGFDAEILAIARIRKHKIREIPVHWNNGTDSKVNIWAYPKTMMEAVHIGINRMRRIYGK